jgi:hypothetical protein
VSDPHIRLLRRVAALRRKAVRDSVAPEPADGSEAHVRRLVEASARADAQLTAATKRRRGSQ